MSTRTLAGRLAGLALVSLLAGSPWGGPPSARACRPTEGPAVEEPVEPVRVTYPVADLVVPAAGGPKHTLERQLVEALTSCVAPNTWHDVGGLGTIEYYPLTLSLVVRQTADVHEQVAEMLAQMRKNQDVQVSVEVRFVCMSEAHFVKLGIDSPEGAKQTVTTLDDAQVHSLLVTAQDDLSATVAQAPRLVCEDGQEAGFSTPEVSAYVRPRALPSGVIDVGLKVVVRRPDAERPAAALRLTPAGDGKSFVLSRAQPRVSTFAAERALSVPEGKTAVLTGWTHVREVRTEKATPADAVPFVGRLLRASETTRQKDHLLVLVTPRVVRHAETAEVPAATVPAQAHDRAVCVEPAPCRAVDDALPASPKAEEATLAYSNSRSLSLGYEVENVGRSRLSGIEVHFAQDGGAWQRYPETVLPVGTVPMEVARDGRYGFVLVARSGAGLSRPAPTPGERPQLTVVVDTVPPSVEMAPPRVAANDSAHAVRLTWKASDANFGAHPVSLEWARTPAGPWHGLASRLPAKGHYADVLPAEAGDCVYVRLTAIDLAGNATQATTPEPVVLDQKVPAVTGVRLRRR